MTTLDLYSYGLGTILMAISLWYVRGVDGHDAIPGIVVMLIALNIAAFVAVQVDTFVLGMLMPLATWVIILTIADRKIQGFKWEL